MCANKYVDAGGFPKVQQRQNRLGHTLKTSQLYLALKAQWPWVLAVSLSLILQTGLTLVQPWPIRSMIDHVIKNPDQGHKSAAGDSLFQFIVSSAEGFIHSGQFEFLYDGIGLLLIFLVSNAVLLYLQNLSLARLGQEVVLYIRENLFSQLISFPHSFFEKARTGDLTSRISKDTADVQDILESLLTIFVRSIPTIIGILVVSFALDWIYATTFLLVIPLVYWSNLVLSRRTKQEIREQRCIEGNMASTVQEAFHYHKVVATLSLEDDMVEGFMQNGRQSARHGMAAGRFQGLLTASLDLLIGAASLLVLFVGILRILHGCLTVGQLMVFLSYLNNLFKPVRDISKFTGRIAKSAAALERIDEIARIDPSELGATELPNAVEAPPFRGRLELDHVTFGYRPGQLVLDDINLKIPAGQRVAIVGDSGSGKSSILHLLMRLYDPSRGEIRIDGIDIRTLQFASLRNQMSVVLQDSYVFNMTIADNIAIARPGAGKAQVLAAARAAQADDFIRGLPDGYDTVLGEDGAGLSGGQKRRLAIARAFLRDAPIVLLDEPTVGLDAASEQTVVEAVRRLTRGKTTIIVTHQLSTIDDVDLIVVMSGGKIVESGTHQQLLQWGGLYKSLWQVQSQEGKGWA